MRKSVTVALLISVPILVSAYISFSHPTGSGITSENYVRIEAGMTEWQIEEVLGVPAGHYGNDGEIFAVSSADIVFYCPASDARIRAEANLGVMTRLPSMSGLIRKPAAWLESRCVIQDERGSQTRWRGYGRG